MRRLSQGPRSGRTKEGWLYLLASPQTSLGARLKWMRDKRTPKDVFGEAMYL